MRSVDVVTTPLTDRAGQALGTGSTIAVLYERGTAASENDIGMQTARILDASAVRLTPGPQSKTYTLEIALPGCPASQTFDLGHTFKDGYGSTITGDSEFGNHIVRTTTYSDGTKSTDEYDADSNGHTLDIVNTSPTTAQQQTLWFNLGLRYVAFGGWDRDELQRITTASPVCSSGQCTRTGWDLAEQVIQFVTGRRTLAGELPRSGSATYDTVVYGRSVVLVDKEQVNLVDNLRLTADFARALMTASIALDPYNDGEYFSPGIKATGSGAITAAGTYAFPLAGTITSAFQPVTTSVLGGSLQGAFFGPGAEEIGGVLLLTQDGTPAFTGTFAGGRTTP